MKAGKNPLDEFVVTSQGRLKADARNFGENPVVRPRLRLLLVLCRALAAAVPVLATACGPSHRFDVQPMPLSTATLLPLGLQGDATAWTCIDAEHDRYLEQWTEVVAQDAAEQARRIADLSNPLSASAPDAWLGDLAVVQSLARRHASTLRKLEQLDTALLEAWRGCLGEGWSDRLEGLRIDRGIDRWRHVAEARGPALLDLRLLLPACRLDPGDRAAMEPILRDYARQLEPLARDLAQARLRAPLLAIQLRERQRSEDGKVDERAIDAQVKESARKPHDAVVKLNLVTLDRCRGSLPDAAVDRIRTSMANAIDRKRPRLAAEMLAGVSLELPEIDEATRQGIRKAMEAHEAADAPLREELLTLALRDPASPEIARIRKARWQALRDLNREVVQALPESMRRATREMQREGLEGVRETLEGVLDPAVASRFERELPDPEPQMPSFRLPVRPGNDVLAQLLPSDYPTWARVRVPPLAEGDPDRQEALAALIEEACTAWTAEMTASLDRLRPMQKLVEEGFQKETTLGELQRRLRTAVAELDATRARLQLIEDPLLDRAAELLEIPPQDPRLERLQVERATEFAGLGWREMPVHTLFQLDREATIELPTVVDATELDEGGRAVADMALVDSAVPLIETAELLRQSCVQSLRSLVLDLKRAQLRGVEDRAMGPVAAEAVRRSAAAVAVHAGTRIRLQRELMEQIARSIDPMQARALRRSYWERAFPELFVEIRPVDPVIDRLVSGLADEASRAAAEGVLEAREAAHDALLPRLVEARRAWPNDMTSLSRGTFHQIERQAPLLGLLLSIRREVDARALRSLASLHGDEPWAWDEVAEWSRERPAAFEGLP